MPAAPLLTALWACQAQGELPIDQGDADAPSAWEYTPPEGDAPLFDAATVAGGIEEGVALALELTGEPVLAGYFASLEEADADCPSWYEQDGNVFWYDYCTSDSGAFFDGYGFYYPYLDADLDGSGVLWTGDYLYGVASVTSSDGAWYHAGGGVQVLDGRGEEDDVNAAMSQVQGGFAWTDDRAAGTWLGTGLVPDLYVYGIEYAAHDARGLYVTGGVSGLTGGVSAVLFAENLIYDLALGSPCAAEPTGSIQVRDEAGRWWVVTFDTPEEGAVDRDACDGCGTVTYAGEEVGEVCVDFSSWLAWEVSPW